MSDAMQYENKMAWFSLIKTNAGVFFPVSFTLHSALFIEHLNWNLL